MALVDQGDHILVTDSAYGPTRHFCDTVLKRFGVETTYYDPLIGSNISGLFRPNTRLVFAESPGTMTFEMQDIPAICEAAHSQDVLVLMDNTWATPLFFKPIKLDVDVSIQAGTKYISGHSDLVIGIITARTEELFQKIKDTTMAIGEIAAPDDCYLALRGLRTMGVRLRQHQSSAYKIADWFNKRPEVKRVLYPPLESDPGHFIWKRDFKGACGLFGVVLHPFPNEAVARMLDNYDLFKIGASWGGFESLVLPCYPAAIRTVNAWKEKGFLLRYHIGLEDPDDLIADLEEGFVRLNKTYTEGEEDL
jgi:cystathionine beta-lyase